MGQHRIHQPGSPPDVIAVEIGPHPGQRPYLLVIHPMPASLRKGGRDV
jgi:hypothetical protein